MIYLNPYFDEFNVKINSISNERTTNKQQICLANNNVDFYNNDDVMVLYLDQFAKQLNVEQIKLLADQIKKIFACTRSSPRFCLPVYPYQARDSYIISGSQFSVHRLIILTSLIHLSLITIEFIF